MPSFRLSGYQLHIVSTDLRWLFSSWFRARKRGGCSLQRTGLGLGPTGWEHIFSINSLGRLIPQPILPCFRIFSDVSTPIQKMSRYF